MSGLCQVTGPRLQKDGSTRVETWVDTVEHAACVDSDGFEFIALDSPPEDHSMVVEGQPVVDEAQRAADEEEARLRRMTLAERQEEAVERALAILRSELGSS